MKKKVLSTLLTLAMIASLVSGCGKTEEETASGDAGNKETASEGTGEAAIDFDEDPYEVYVQYVGLFEENKNIKAVEDAINAIALEKINCTVHLVPTFIGDLPTNTSLQVAGGEKIDVITVGLTQALSSAVPDGLLLELEDLIAERGADVSKVTANVMEAGTIDGHVYAVSGYPYAAMGTGFVYNKTLADQYGIEMKDYMTMDDLAAAGEILKENGVYLTSFPNSTQLNYKFFSGIDSFGDGAIFGGITDPTESTTVENIYATDGLRDYFKGVKGWADAGYLPEGQLTDTTTVQEYFSQQKIFGTSSAYTINQITSWLTPDFETGMVQLTDGVISTSSATEFMLGIASTCERPDKAMDVINLIYGDAEVANLIQYGIEGTDYAAVEGTENVITRDGTANADRNSYFSPFVHFGNPMDLKVVSPLTDSYYDDLQAFEDSAKKSLSFGYTFDGSDYSAEAGAISAVLQEKLPMLNAGQVADVDTALDELIAAIEAAGINDVIKANQTQLDEYLAK